jgi:hypothetical protein
VWGLAAVTRDDPAKSEALYETKKNWGLPTWKIIGRK